LPNKCVITIEQINKTRKMKKILYILSLLYISSFSTIETIAKPQYTMLTGNRCLNCHTNVAGGGMRNTLGMYSRGDVGQFEYSSIGMGDIMGIFQESNEIVEDVVSFGFDFRQQSAKVGRTTAPERTSITMQIMPYLRVKATDWLDFQGSYNFANTPFPGQQNWGAFATIQPGGATMPQLRIGYMQPQIAMRIDDHTALTRKYMAQFSPGQLLPPDMNDWGAELNYDGIKWLSLSAGVFNSKTISEIAFFDTKLSRDNHLTSVGRVTFTPQFHDLGITAMLGGSVAINPDFNIFTGFAGIGLNDYVSLLVEYLNTDHNSGFQSQAITGIATFMIFDFLLLEARAETTQGGPQFRSFDPLRQFVFGLHYNPFPFIELRPEYRIIDTSLPGYFSQYAFQLHLFY